MSLCQSVHTEAESCSDGTKTEDFILSIVLGGSQAPLMAFRSWDRDTDQSRLKTHKNNLQPDPNIIQLNLRRSAEKKVRISTNPNVNLQLTKDRLIGLNPERNMHQSLSFWGTARRLRRRQNIQDILYTGQRLTASSGDSPLPALSASTNSSCRGNTMEFWPRSRVDL